MGKLSSLKSKAILGGVVLFAGLYMYTGFQGRGFISEDASMPEGDHPMGLNLFFDFGDLQEVALLSEAIRNDPVIAKAMQVSVSSRSFTQWFFRRHSIRVGSSTGLFPLVEERVKSIVSRMYPKSHVEFQIASRATSPAH